jgi:hypothetical protein
MDSSILAKLDNASRIELYGLVIKASCKLDIGATAKTIADHVVLASIGLGPDQIAWATRDAGAMQANDSWSRVGKEIIVRGLWSGGGAPVQTIDQNKFFAKAERTEILSGVIPSEERPFPLATEPPAEPQVLSGVTTPKHSNDLLPRRWVVERTFAWLGRCRRLAKDGAHLMREIAHNWISSVRIKVDASRIAAATPSAAQSEDRSANQKTTFFDSIDPKRSSPPFRWYM